MAKRSPILGFNHNFSHRGLVFHIQTEDSGVNNPHIFTHLFNGGVILSSCKLTYDADSAVEVVKALMQAQHKRMLKDLKKGVFDAKISEFFAADPRLDGGITTKIDVDMLEEVDQEAEKSRSSEPRMKHPYDSRPNPFENLQITPPSGRTLLGAGPSPILNLGPPPVPPGPPPIPQGARPVAARPVAAPSPVAETPSGAAIIHAKAPESAPEPPGVRPEGPGAYHRTGMIRRIESHEISAKRVTPKPAPPRAVRQRPGGKAASGRRIRQPTMSFASEQLEHDSEVPSVIVGAPPQVVGASKRDRAERDRADIDSKQGKHRNQSLEKQTQLGGSLFGKDLISEKSLDEVILAYLSEDSSEK